MSTFASLLRAWSYQPVHLSTKTEAAIPQHPMLICVWWSHLSSLSLPLPCTKSSTHWNLHELLWWLNWQKNIQVFSPTWSESELLAEVHESICILSIRWVQYSNQGNQFSLPLKLTERDQVFSRVINLLSPHKSHGTSNTTKEKTTLI